MRNIALIITVSLSLAGCVSPYLLAKIGRIGGTVLTMWVGADKFVYVPGAEGKNFAFETASTGRVIAPGLMYTDGGSIPRIGQIITGLSPWGFGPAYIVHDWIFYGRHCYVDPAPAEFSDVARFDDVNGKNGSLPITFDESALILAEVIKTLVDYGQVREQAVAAEIISSGVDSPIARALWNKKGGCESYRVTPFHIAVVWLSVVGENKQPPATWKLSQWEIAEAIKEFPRARLHIKSLTQDKGREPDRKRRLRGDEIAQN
jgi:hypothetical protein